MPVLVIGYGNLERADDGVAFHVVNALRRALGQPPLKDDETGLETLGQEVDAVFIGQLTPETMDILHVYEKVVFVDAHVDPHRDDLLCCPVEPEEGALTFSHHINPAILLAFYAAMHAREVDGYLVSLRGHYFDLDRRLSAQTAELIAPAVERILSLTVTNRW